MQLTYAINCLEQQLWEIENVWMCSDLADRVVLKKHAKEIQFAIQLLEQASRDTAA